MEKVLRFLCICLIGLPALLFFTTKTFSAKEIEESQIESEVTVFDHHYHSEHPETYEDLTVIVEKKDLIIIGGDVQIEQHHGNGLFETYFNGNQTAIDKITIFAETLTIASPAVVKGIDVDITAKDVIFEGGGKLTTTPDPISLIETPVDISANGEQGNNAGDVRLYANTVTNNSSESIVLDLKGGKGGKNGPGEQGEAGTSLTLKEVDECIWHYAPPPWIFGKTQCAWPDIGYTLLSSVIWAGSAYEHSGCTTCGWGNNTNGWPTSGDSGQPAGQPGAGGKGGSLTTNVAGLDSYTSTDGGDVGDVYYTYYLYDHSDVPSLRNMGTAQDGRRYVPGGAAGTPQKSQKINQTYYYPNDYVRGDKRRVTRAGDPLYYTITVQPGANGAINHQSGDDYAWLHPTLVNKILHKAKNLYLDNDFEGAKAILEEYIPYLEDAIGMENIVENGEYDFQLAQPHAEMRILLNQIEYGLDYFGNPAGWVPLLSFEYSLGMFEGEIERALKTLYLSYWISDANNKTKDKKASITALRDEMWNEFNASLAEYDELHNKMPQLNQKLDNLDSNIVDLQNDLRQMEEDYKEQAEKNLLPGVVAEATVRIGLKVGATICSMVPVGQPALMTLGTGTLNALSNIDAEEPWDTILETPSIINSYNEKRFSSAERSLKFNAWNVDGVPDKKQAYDDWKAKRNATLGLANGTQDIANYVEGLGVPDDKLYTEIEKLKAMDPQYHSVFDRLENLMKEKQELFKDLLETVAQINQLVAEMDQGLLAMDSLNRELINNSYVLDDQTAGYLDDIARRAWDRLLKYHYLVAKAYEYRMLAPYPNALNMEPVITKIKALVTQDDHTLDSGHYDALKGVYYDLISEVTDAIYSTYQSYVEREGSLELVFSGEHLDAINSGDTISLNLKKQNKFYPAEENIRITGFEVVGFETESDSGWYGGTSYVNVWFKHSGESRIQMDGDVYLFRHFSDQSSQSSGALKWGVRYKPNLNESELLMPSDASGSLLRDLLDEPSEHTMLYSRPAAWTDLKIYSEVHDDGGNSINIIKLTVKLHYDFSEQLTYIRDIDVMPMADNKASDIKPYFSVNPDDLNYRKDGIGRFVRSYFREQTVTITAEPFFENYVFTGWTDHFGNELPGGPYADTSILLNSWEDNPNKVADQMIAANYRYDKIKGDLDGQMDVDGLDLASFAYAFNVQNSAADLNTDGSVDDADLAVFASKFGLIKR